MKKFITILVLAGVLVVPAVSLAQPCSEQQAASCEKAIGDASCVCGNKVAEIGKFCWARGNQVFSGDTAQADCNAAMAAAAEEEEEILPEGLAAGQGCTIKHEVKGCLRETPIGAGEFTDCSQGSTTCQSELCCLMDRVYTLANWIFVILLVVAGMFVIWAAFDFVLSKGDPEKVTSARSKLTWALVGVIIAFIARGLVTLIMQIIA